MRAFSNCGDRVGEFLPIVHARPKRRVRKAKRHDSQMSSASSPLENTAHGQPARETETCSRPSNPPRLLRDHLFVVRPSCWRFDLMTPLLLSHVEHTYAHERRDLSQGSRDLSFVSFPRHYRGTNVAPGVHRTEGLLLLLLRRHR